MFDTNEVANIFRHKVIKTTMVDFMMRLMIKCCKKQNSFDNLYFHYDHSSFRLSYLACW